MNSRNLTDKLVLVGIVMIGAWTTSMARAQTHTGDIVLMLVNSRLATSGGTYAGPLNGRVFDGFFPSSGVTSSPGFDSGNGLLQPGQTIRFDFVREVLYWNGSTLTQSPRSMAVIFGSSQATLSPTDFGGRAGFEIKEGNAQGAFHEHLNFSIGSGADPGVYGVILTLAMMTSGSDGPVTFGRSEPFLMAFRRNASLLNPAAGLDAMAAELAAVPEPTTLGLAVAGAAVAIVCRRQRRGGPPQSCTDIAHAKHMH